MPAPEIKLMNNYTTELQTEFVKSSADVSKLDVGFRKSGISTPYACLLCLVRLYHQNERKLVPRGIRHL